MYFSEPVVIAFIAGGLYSIFICLAKQFFFRFKIKRQSYLPLWSSWVFATFLRIFGLIFGYLLITWYFKEKTISTNMVGNIAIVYSVAIFFGLLVDLLRSIKSV